MRKIPIAEGSGIVEVRGRRATVKVRGRYVGQAVKLPGGGRWAVGYAAYPSAADAAEALAEAAYGEAA